MGAQSAFQEIVKSIGRLDGVGFQNVMGGVLKDPRAAWSMGVSSVGTMLPLKV